MDFSDFIGEYRQVIFLVASLMALAVAMKYWWEEVSFYFLRIASSFPFIGKISKLSKNIDSIDKDGWFHSEKTLCANFIHHYRTVNKDAEFYDRCSIYLSRVQETGRDNLHLFGWLLLCSMVFVEAMGFSYVLAGYTIPGASESLQKSGAYGIAFLMSGLLVYLTHATGGELHKNRLVAKIRAWHDLSKGKLVPNNSVTLDKNDADENDSASQQLLNRLDTNANVKAGYYITIGTIIFIIMVASGATFVRGMALQQMLTEEAALMQEADDDLFGSATFSDPFAAPSGNQVPAELSDIQDEADQQAQDEIIASQKQGGWATFIVLAVIFVFMQVMGILIGFFKGFAGKESESARKYIGKFKTREEFAEYYDRKRRHIAQIAQKNLSIMQQSMAKRAQNGSCDGTVIQKITDHSDRTFLAFADNELKKDMAHRVNTLDKERAFAGGQPTRDNQHGATGSAEESVAERIERIKRQKAAQQAQTEEEKMAQMTDDELEQYLIARGDI